MDRNTAGNPEPKNIHESDKRTEKVATQGAGTTGRVCPTCGRRKGKTENIHKSGKYTEKVATQGAGTRRCPTCGRPM